MGFQIMGTNHLKARCTCYLGDPKTPHGIRKGCPLHDLPVPVMIDGVDMVNHPPHYTSHPSGIEAIEIGRHLTADWFNAFKYVFRADHKNGKQDIDKACWYAKDGTEHDIPIHAPTWRFKHQQLLQQIIDAEVDENRIAFFSNILIGNRSGAWACATAILDTWPS